MNRMALLISAVLTAMVVAVLGGVVYSARATELAKANTIVQQDVPQDIQQVNSSSGLDAQTQEQIQQTIEQRDAAYQALINEANTRLEQAQQKQQELEAQIAAMQAATAGASADASASAAQAPAAVVPSLVSPEQAAQIAAVALGQSKIYSVESASFNGIPAYKVTFSSGDVAFVSMDGQLLTVQRAKNAQPGKVVARANDHDDDGEHEGGGDD